ncbi:excinuclease ABC subunit UvrA [Anaeromicropila populeti]|uniref:UvrABC system protein A n=1 Tax=Anaeromicropila populeti TaxID=37658 RepID=A0A1I6L3V6_9FIRM|nr:excinuclease ABC subunit UvrA [Anaeromicropila populeti]SFR98151.1 excinuclease ABC subunit A [Anaeromicropila populeti]
MKIDGNNDECRDLYRTQSIITNPGRYELYYKELPTNINRLCEIIQGLFINFKYCDQYDIKISKERIGESNLRYVSKILEAVVEKNADSILNPRENKDKLLVTNRSFAVLLVSMIRHFKIPARAVCGFFHDTSEQWESHWICEYWSKKAGQWIKIDASLDAVAKDCLHIKNEGYRVPDNRFLTSEQVWKDCRAGRQKDSIFGYDDKTGLGFIRGNLLRNFVTANRYEALHTDNWWKFKNAKDMKKEDFEQLDNIADALLSRDDSIQRMQELFETETDIYTSVTGRIKDNYEVGPAEEKERLKGTVLMNENQKIRRDISLKQVNFDTYDENYVVVEGAKHHNLKNINLRIPKNKLVVFTGVSGSGKSTLIFDTIFAEAQRRFLVGFSPFVRRHMEKFEKPKVDSIYGLSPAIAIEQKQISNNPRSTVGTITEISDYLRLLYSRVGTPYCLSCGQPIVKMTPREIALSLFDKIEKGVRFTIYAPLIIASSLDCSTMVNRAFQAGYCDIKINGSIEHLESQMNVGIETESTVEIKGDSFIIPEDINQDVKNHLIDQITESIRRILEYGRSTLRIEDEGENDYLFTTQLVCPCCHTGFPELSSQHFSSNTPLGMCPACGGLGIQQSIDEKLLIENPNVSILDGAIKWYGNLRQDNKTTWPTGPLDVLYNHYQVNIETPWKELPENFRNVILYGSGEEKLCYKSTLGNRASYKPVKGLVPELTRLYYETDSEVTKKKYGQYMDTKLCDACHGTKLCEEARHVKVDNKAITEINDMPVSEVKEWIKGLYEKLEERLFELGEEIILEVYNRLCFLNNIGLHYLTLSRTAPTLSGGEGQRVRLASQLSSGMMGVLYILDEPSVGLHPKDIDSLIKTLYKLRDQGNSVLVVEHDQEIIEKADWLVDVGPRAGILGGQIISQGTPEDVALDPNSITGQYLSNKKNVFIEKKCRKMYGDKWLVLKGAKHNNLKNVTVHFPIGKISCVTGVSGSGKSSLVGGILEPLLDKLLNGGSEKIGSFEAIEGWEHFDKIVNVSQAPIGRSPKSNPATYTGLFDKIRKVFAKTEYAIANKLTYEYFSFNSEKGQCKECKGVGQTKVEMHFLAEIWVPCTECGGTRYQSKILNARYKGKNIAEVLDMDVEEALELFSEQKDIVKILQTFKDVGLEYIKLGQSATTLSGGEAQRVKLAKELSEKTKGNMIYILDEPTTGLHFNDIQYLLNIFDRLADLGHTLIIIEHNLDIIKSADWIVDIGPEGGVNGGRVCAEGVPEEIAEVKESYTGQALKRITK